MCGRFGAELCVDIGPVGEWCVVCVGDEGESVLIKGGVGRVWRGSGGE